MKRAGGAKSSHTSILADVRKRAREFAANRLRESRRVLIAQFREQASAKQLSSSETVTDAIGEFKNNVREQLLAETKARASIVSATADAECIGTTANDARMEDGMQDALSYEDFMLELQQEIDDELKQIEAEAFYQQCCCDSEHAWTGAADDGIIEWAEAAANYTSSQSGTMDSSGASELLTCPVCLQWPAHLDWGLLHCRCGIRIRLQQDQLSLHDIAKQVEIRSQEHSG